MIKSIIQVVATSVLFTASLAAESAKQSPFQCSFARNGWDPNDWTIVKSPRWDHQGTWEQKDLYIVNQTPADAQPEDMISRRAGETYTSMVLKRKFTPDITIRARMEFTHRMAPLIVIAPELGRDARDRPEYRVHYEVVIYDKGLNVWRHDFKDGKPWWKRIAAANFPLKPDTVYQLAVTIRNQPHGKELAITVDGRHIAILREDFPEQFHVGITGCEGINRFYDLHVHPVGKD